MLETPRLILRPYEERDYDDLYELLSQRREDQFEAYSDITYENTREQLTYRMEGDNFWAMELKSTGKVVGSLYFSMRSFDTRELGYIVNKDYQRQGFAREAARAIITDAFRAGLHRIYAECDPRNNCSWGLLENLGFRREALLKQNIWFRKDAGGNPIWQDTCVYAMLKEEWDF